MKTAKKDTEVFNLFEIEINNEYFTWLCNIININRPRDSYFILAQTLHKRDYTWFIPNDDNRAADGIKLREKFADELRYDNISRILNRNSCSLLEMLIGVSIRIEDILYDPEEGDRTERWFWEILGNIGLDIYTDSKYADVYGREKINILIDIVLNRTYRRNGKGGLFPLKGSRRDQRKIEIWYQMCEYLNENYFINGGNLLY